MRLCALLLAGALLLASGAAQARQLQQTTGTRYYGKSLYECVQNAGLSTTKAMIDAAGADVKALFNNPSLAVTFLAPDNNNWITWTKYQKAPYPTTINALLADSNLCANLIRNHIVEKPYTTAAWPSKAGTQYGKTQTTASGMALTWWVDYKYTFRCGGFYPGYDQLGCQLTNLQCGNSIMHVITDAWDMPTPPS